MTRFLNIALFALLTCFSTSLSAVVYTVINTNDSGAGSLRQAMTSAAASSIGDDIEFNIPGMAPHVISIGATTGISLPQMSTSSGRLSIEGTTQPANGYTGISPKIILDGTSVTAGSDQDGLNIWGTGSEVFGLYIRNFPHHGIALAADNSLVGGPGKSNVISGNGDNGVYIFIVTNNATVQTNMIGVEPDGVTAFGNGGDGVHIWQSSNNNQIGGPSTAEGNIIAYNDNGVSVRSGINNPISHNSIFCNVNKGIFLSTFSPGGNNAYTAPIFNQGSSTLLGGNAPPNDIIEVFEDDNCSNVEGKTFVGSVVTNAMGNWTLLGSFNGTYTATATNPANNNTSEFSVDYTVAGIPPVIADFVVSNPAFCAGGCVDFTDGSTGSPGAWIWSFPGGNPSSATVQSPTNICYDSPGVYDVTLTAIGTAGSDTLTKAGYITVYALPAASAGGNTSTCLGDSITLTASGGGSYLWSPGGETTASITVGPVLATDYSVAVTDSNGCSASDTASVSINALPVVSLGSDTTLCIGCQITLDPGNPGSTFLWSTGATSNTILVNAPGTYWVQVTGPAGCVSSDTILIEQGGVSLDNALSFDLQVYPNPASTDLQLAWADMGTALDVILMDVHGRALFSQSQVTSSHLGIDVSSLSSGIYLLKVAAPDLGQVSHFKIQIQH